MAEKLTVAQELSPYRPEWPGEFREIAARLRGSLGPLALRVDHIGSTAVPGLTAKDRIDIQVTVADFSPAADARLTDALTALGYAPAPDVTRDHQPPGDTSPESEWEKRYFRPPAGQRATNLHVRAEGRANQRYALLFRDYLRACPPAASAYAELKRRLAAYVGPDRDAYVEIKDPACDLIMVGAEAWAATVGWMPGPSDG
jgi:GrpB-like predicted nucleotidyltransferase (UPF0157 family)